MPYRCQICKDLSDTEGVYQSDRDYPSDISDSDAEYLGRRWRRLYSRRRYQHRRGTYRSGYTRSSSEIEKSGGHGTKEAGRSNSRTYRRRKYWTEEGRKSDNNDEFRSERESNVRDNSRERFRKDSDSEIKIDIRSAFRRVKDYHKNDNERNQYSNSDSDITRTEFSERKTPELDKTIPTVETLKTKKDLAELHSLEESSYDIKHDSSIKEAQKHDNEYASSDKFQETNKDNTVDNKTDESDSKWLENKKEKEEVVTRKEKKQEIEEETNYKTDSDSFWECSSDTGTESDTDSDSDENNNEDRDAIENSDRVKRYARNQSSGNRENKSPAKSRRRRSLTISYVRMPSGKRHPISTPNPKEFKCGTQTKRITLHKNGRTSGKEYKIVEKEMQDSIVHHEGCMNGGGCFKNYEIVKIEKLINGCMWKRYRHIQQDIITEHGYANQKMLFHGSAKVEDIVTTGFDERYSNFVGGMFGAGLYFAKHSSKANQYAYGYMGGSGCPLHSDKNCHLCERKLLLCRVTLGRSKNLFIGEHLAHPPAQYNSVAGVPSKQKGGLRYPEWIIYRGEQVYPEYMITYKIKD